MTFDLTNLKQQRRAYIDFHIEKFNVWREKNVGVEAALALAEGAAGQNFKDSLSKEEMGALNTYLREDAPR